MLFLFRSLRRENASHGYNHCAGCPAVGATTKNIPVHFDGTKVSLNCFSSFIGIRHADLANDYFLSIRNQLAFTLWRKLDAEKWPRGTIVSENKGFSCRRTSTAPYATSAHPGKTWQSIQVSREPLSQRLSQHCYKLHRTPLSEVRSSSGAR